jgi:poly(hydroxyalkanoate) depolymerase family esterase
VLFPEQKRANNANLCFNWFEKADTVRDHGEALSIRQMIETLVAQCTIDRKRVFITGLSAGGAMANVMLATYPEVFAAGAIIAGLPYGVASTVPEAFDRMRGHGLADRSRLQQLLKAAAPSSATWPSIAVWHGTGDQTVSLVNATAIVDQWRGVLGVDGNAPAVTKDEGAVRQVWRNDGGQVVLSLHSITGMGHGTPVDASNERENSGPFMLDVGISSTAEIAADWGLTPSFERRQKPTTSQTAPLSPLEAPNLSLGIKQTIEAALRAAGLMK